jgi:hypothetical protein
MLCSFFSSASHVGGAAAPASQAGGACGGGQNGGESSEDAVTIIWGEGKLRDGSLSFRCRDRISVLGGAKDGTSRLAVTRTGKESRVCLVVRPVSDILTSA